MDYENLKEKLEAYSNGTLPKEERLQVENELDKLELYQSYLDDLMTTNKNEVQKNKQLNEMKLVKKGLWKARIQNALTAISILFLICIGCSIITSIFYSWGDPNRVEKYTEIIRTSLEATRPNIEIGSSGSNTGMLTLNFTGELRKQIGDNQKNIGVLKTSFFFGLPKIDIPSEINNKPFFLYPEQQKGIQPDDGFNKLKHLPEGTVSELYISLSDYVSTNKVLSYLNGKEMRPVWFAVDTGLDHKNLDHFDDTLGFPYYGFNLQKNFKVTSRSKNGNTETVTGGSQSLEAYGDGEKRDKEFLDVLDLMKSNYMISRKFTNISKKDINKTITYIHKNGVRVYGVVVTGPTKELLKLQNEKWVGKASVGEVDFWNWNNSN